MGQGKARVGVGKEKGTLFSYKTTLYKPNTYRFKFS